MLPHAIVVNGSGLERLHPSSVSRYHTLIHQRPSR